MLTTVCLLQQGPRISLYMVLFAIIASMFSTFWAFGYTRLARKVKRYADALENTDIQSKVIKKRDVKRTLRNGLTVNVLGMGSALLGLQAMVGMLVSTHAYVSRLANRVHHGLFRVRLCCRHRHGDGIQVTDMDTGTSHDDVSSACSRAHDSRETCSFWQLTLCVACRWLKHCPVLQSTPSLAGRVKASSTL